MTKELREKVHQLFLLALQKAIKFVMAESVEEFREMGKKPFQAMDYVVELEELLSSSGSVLLTKKQAFEIFVKGMQIMRNLLPESTRWKKGINFRYGDELRNEIEPQFEKILDEITKDNKS